MPSLFVEVLRCVPLLVFKMVNQGVGNKRAGSVFHNTRNFAGWGLGEGRKQAEQQRQGEGRGFHGSAPIELPRSVDWESKTFR
jgi:hypothetical protein